MAVVDPQLRVKGVRGLRIADGSIMPFLPAINPCITTMMIGEKCADLVKPDARAGAARGGAGRSDAGARRPRRTSTPCSSTASGGRPRSGETAATTSPATGEVIGTVPQGDRGGRRAGDRRRQQRVRGLVAADRLRARGEDARRRRRDRAPPRRAGAHAHARPGQAAEGGGLRRGRRAGRVLAHGRRGRQAARAGSCRTRSRPASGCMLVRRARGAVGIISPWNWPYTMPAELLAPALACGNTVVWTPAPTTAVSAVALAECMAEADLPPGVVQPRDRARARWSGDEIARNPGTRGVGFIGSTGHRALGRLRGRGQGGDHRDGRQRPDRGARRRGSRRAPSRRPSRRASCAPGRAARQASACSSTRRCATSSSTASRAA